MNKVVIYIALMAALVGMVSGMNTILYHEDWESSNDWSIVGGVACNKSVTNVINGTESLLCTSGAVGNLGSSYRQITTVNSTSGINGNVSFYFSTEFLGSTATNSYYVCISKDIPQGSTLPSHSACMFVVNGDVRARGATDQSTGYTAVHNVPYDAVMMVDLVNNNFTLDINSGNIGGVTSTGTLDEVNYIWIGDYSGSRTFDTSTHLDDVYIEIEVLIPTEFTTVTSQFPINNTIYKGNYNNSVVFDTTVNNGSVTCDINSTEFYESTTPPYVNDTVVFLYNTTLGDGQKDLFVNCSKSDYASYANYTISFEIDKKTIGLYDTDGSSVISTCYLDSVLYPGSVIDVYTHNMTSPVFTCDSTDTFIALSETLLDDGNDINFTRNKARLILKFNASVDVVVSGESNDVFFYQTDIINVTQEQMPLGLVTVKYGVDNYSKQTFEYINDYATYVEENLFVINNPTYDFYVSVQTSSGQGVSDAYMYLYEFNATINITGNTTKGKYGQFISYNREPTYMLLDGDKMYSIVIQKTGFLSKYITMIIPKQMENSFNTPFVIELESTSLADAAPFLYWTEPRLLHNLTDNQIINFNIQLPNYAILRNSNAVYMTTSYREAYGAANGLGTALINGTTAYWKKFNNNVLSDYDLITRKYTVSMTEDIDFDKNDTVINVTILSNYNNVWRTSVVHVPIYHLQNRDITIQPESDWSHKTVMLFGFIILLAIVSFVKFTFQNQEVSFNVFMIGIAALSMISLQYILASFVVILYYGLTWVKKVNGEAV